MYHSTIYDKMRLFLQREGSPLPAVAYGVLSHCSWAIGLYRQNREAELRGHTTEVVIDKLVNRLLRPANCLDMQNRLSQMVFERIRNMQSLTLQEIFDEVNLLLT